MDVNIIQRQIAELKTKFEEIGLCTYYDEEYHLKIKNKDYDALVTFNTSDDNNFLLINVATESTFNDTISIEDIEKLISIKEDCEQDLFDSIVNYIFFNKKNQLFIDIISKLIMKNAQVMHEMIENNEINETENEVADSTVNRNQEISNYIIEFLNKELSDYGLRKFIKNKRYYISEDNEVAVLVMRSKRYDRGPYKYWYTFHKYQKDILDKYKSSYIILYFDDKDECILLEAEKLYTTLSKLGKTQNGDSIGWHLHIQEINGVYSIRIPYEGLLNIKKDGTLELEPFKKNRMRNHHHIDSDIANNIDASNDEGQLNNNDDVTLKISYDDFKVIKFKKN